MKGDGKGERTKIGWKTRKRRKNKNRMGNKKQISNLILKIQLSEKAQICDLELIFDIPFGTICTNTRPNILHT